jgi:transposase
MYRKDITELLGIQGFFVSDTEIQEDKVIFDISREKETFCCSKCGQWHFVYYDKHTQIIRDLDMSGKQVYLRIEKHRVLCDCDSNGKGGRVVVEKLGFVNIGRRMTKRFEAYIFMLTLRMTVKDISEITDLNWHTIHEIEKREIKKRRHGIRWEKIKYLAVDEISWNGGREYLTIVTDRSGQGVVWIGDGKGKETLDKFFTYICEDRYKRFRLFTIDMNSGYISSIKDFCPGAKVVYDLFHIMRNLNKKLNEVRAEEMARGRNEGKEYHRNDKWLIIKSEESLSKGEKIDLQKLLEENKNIQKGYLLKEALREIFKERRQTVEILTERIKNWVEQAWDTGLKPLKLFCNMLITHFDGIVNYFRYHVTNSLAEGMNNVIKRLNRMAYGYRDKEYFKLKIIQKCSFIADSIPL